jgi:uncharacterized membrane protein
VSSNTHKSFNASYRAHGMKGSIAILAALSLSALIGMMALAIDLTRLFLAQSQLQSLSDSCALAAMHVLPCANMNAAASSCKDIDYAAAAEAGQRVAQANQTPGSDAMVTVSFPKANQVQCQSELVGFVPSLMKVFEVGEQNLNAQALATVWPQQSACSTCGSTHFAGAENSTGSLIPVLVQ